MKTTKSLARALAHIRERNQLTTQLEIVQAENRNLRAGLDNADKYAILRRKELTTLRAEIATERAHRATIVAQLARELELHARRAAGAHRDDASLERGAESGS